MSTCVFHGMGETFYRIPGIVALKSGVLIAYCEERNAADDWSKINLVYRRSTNGGRSWESQRTIVDGRQLGLTVNNPVMIADDMSGTVHCLYEIEYGIGVDGGIFYTYSSDDGVNWSEPINLTAVTLPEVRNVIASGPGHGIQLRNGTLLVPVWMVLKSSKQPLKSHHPAVVSTLYSKDFGKTWNLGEFIYPNESVKDPNESTVVELSDGRVMINCRNVSAEKFRAVSVSETGCGGWRVLTHDKSLEDPVCFGSLARYNQGVILFSNCASQQARENITIKISYDDGASWEREKLLVRGTGGYSDIAVDSNHYIYVLTENRSKQDYYSIRLYKFNLQWLLSNKTEAKR